MRRLISNPYNWLILPVLVFLSLFFILPLLRMMQLSLTDPVIGLGNYVEFFGTEVYRRVLFRTVLIAVAVTAVTAVVAYPYAVVMSRSSPRVKLLMLAVVMVPFWVSLMVRTYSWLVLLQDNGAINQALGIFGLGPFSLIRNSFGLTIGMVQILLPFMVLPLYATLSKIDERHMQAAASLGAKPLRAFLRVYLPLSRPGLLAGSLIVFIVALGFYITPQLLGSPQQSMLSQLAAQQTTRLLNLGMGGTMATILLLTALLLLAVAAKLLGRSFRIDEVVK